MIVRRTLSRTLACVFLPVVAACHSYVPVSRSAVPPAAEVRVNLSESARERLAAMMPAGARHLDGRFIEGRGDGLALEVALMANSEYVQSRLMIQRVSLDGDDIVSVELREINRLKTGLFTAAISAAAVAVVVKVFSGKAGGGRYPPLGPGPSEAVIPGYRPPITPVWTRVRR